MSDQIQLFQVLPHNILIPMVTSAQGEVDAAETMVRYPDAGYHFIYAKMALGPVDLDSDLRES